MTMILVFIVSAIFGEVGTVYVISHGQLRVMLWKFRSSQGAWREVPEYFFEPLCSIRILVTLRRGMHMIHMDPS